MLKVLVPKGESPRASGVVAVTTSLVPGDVVQSKYRIGAPVEGASHAFVATRVDETKKVVLFRLSAAEKATLEPAVGVTHMHLAQLLEVVEAEQGHYGVAEWFDGLSLAERLADLGKKETVDAVRSALRIADALSALHDAGGCHGFVHPQGILVEVEERDPPLLGYFPTEDVSFRSPERGAAGAPSAEDDAWAVGALLHAMLTGDPPPADGYNSEADLADAGVQDSALSAALAHALAREFEARNRDVRPLKRELARWFVEHAGEEPQAHSGGPRSTQPPPLPPSAPPRSLSTPAAAASRAPEPAPRSFSQRIVPLAAASVVLGLIGGWVFNVLRPKPAPAAAEVAALPAPQPVPGRDQPIELGDVPVTGERASVSEDKLSSCAMGYLPKGSFSKSPSLEWVCDEVDPRAGADKLRSAVVSGAAKPGTPTDAMKLFSRIGCYDMAALAVVRAGCCPDAKPLALPEPSPGCSDVAETLRDIGREVVAMHAAEDSVQKYTAAIECEQKANRGPLFRSRERPTSAESSAFLELVKATQTP